MIIQFNNLGWQIDKVSKGFIVIRKSGSILRLLLSCTPLWFYIVIVFPAVFTHERFKNPISIILILGLIIPIYLSYLLRNVVFFINTKKKILMDSYGHDRFRFQDLSIYIDEKNNLYQLVFINNAKGNRYIVWESSNIAEVRKIEEFLKISL